MTGFGDWEPDDSFDTADVDAEQLARKLAFLEGIKWEDMTEEWRAIRLVRMLRFVEWLTRSGHFR
jgi:hypothetical protein